MKSSASEPGLKPCRVKKKISIINIRDRKYFCYQIKEKQKEKQKIVIPLQFSSKITVSREITLND